MNAEQAIKAHREWKARFLAAMGKLEKMDVSRIRADDLCHFGQWLHGSEAKGAFGHLAEYRQCVEAHKAFHAEAGRVAELVNAADMHAAASKLNHGTPYAEASESLSMAVIAMFKAAGGA